MLGERVEQRPHHASECERRPDVADPCGIVKEPLGEEGTEVLAQLVEMEQHQPDDNDEQVRMSEDVLEARPRSSV